MAPDIGETMGGLPLQNPICKRSAIVPSWISDPISDCGIVGG